MTFEYIRGLIRKQPFERFVIYLSDGRSFVVEHPDFISLPPERISSTFFVWNKDRSFDILSLRQVTGISSTGDLPRVPDRSRGSDEDR